jgi:hypothetical protein
MCWTPGSVAGCGPSAPWAGPTPAQQTCSSSTQHRCGTQNDMAFGTAQLRHLLKPVLACIAPDASAHDVRNQCTNDTHMQLQAVDIQICGHVFTKLDSAAAAV